MFALTSDDLSGTMLDCAAGPASFNAELSAAGHEVISCDPLYSHTAENIRSRLDATYSTVVANARAGRGELVWQEFKSPEHLGEVHMSAMQRSLADFPKGTAEGRYIDRSLPHLGFSDDEFDLALCSHFLFTHSDQLSVEFHVAAIEEMCRVAAEARVFPLLKGYGGPSPYLKPVLGLLRALGYHTGVRKAPYEFQGGGDEMLVAKKPVPQGIGCGWPVSCRYGRARRVQRRRRLANMVRAVAPTLIKEARSCSASLASGGL